MAGRRRRGNLALYAIDALDRSERTGLERHLAGCKHCSTQLKSLSQAALALALAIEPVEPPQALRQRILTAAHSER
jgi:anti-sigma factor RsiW